MSQNKKKRYYKVAQRAIEQFEEKYSKPEDATFANLLQVWTNSGIEEGLSDEAVKKPCPKHAFVSLYSLGKVRGYNAFDHTSKQKIYIRKMLTLSPEKLQNSVSIDVWRFVIDSLVSEGKEEINPEISHNGQMDVFLAFWENDKLNND